MYVVAVQQPLLTKNMEHEIWHMHGLEFKWRGKVLNDFWSIQLNYLVEQAKIQLSSKFNLIRCLWFFTVYFIWNAFYGKHFL